METEKTLVFAVMLALRKYVGNIISLRDLRDELKGKLKENNLAYYVDEFVKEGSIARLSNNSIEFL